MRSSVRKEESSAYGTRKKELHRERERVRKKKEGKKKVQLLSLCDC